VATAEICRESLKANEIGIQLLQTNFSGDIEGLDRVFAKDAVRRQAMTRLEALDGAVNIAVEGGGHPGLATEIACNRQTLAQRLDGRVANAELQLGLARIDLRPAAVRCNALILCDRLLNVGNRTGAEDWRVGDRDRRRARRRLGIELFVPVSTRWSVEKIVERRLGESRSCYGRRTESSRGPQERAARERFNSVFLRHIPTIQR